MTHAKFGVILIRSTGWPLVTSGGHPYWFLGYRFPKPWSEWWVDDACQVWSNSNKVGILTFGDLWRSPEGLFGEKPSLPLLRGSSKTRYPKIISNSTGDIELMLCACTSNFWSFEKKEPMASSAILVSQNTHF